MSDMPPSASAKAYFEARPTGETHFSWLRTRMSAERTILAYARSAISFIGIGFTAFEFMASRGTQALLDTRNAHAPEIVGSALVGIGVVLVATGLWDYFDFLADSRDKAYETIAVPKALRLNAGTPISVALLALIAVYAFVIIATQR